MDSLTLALILLPISVVACVCIYQAHRIITTQDRLIQSLQLSKTDQEQILDGLLTIIDEYLEHLSVEMDEINEHDDSFHGLVMYAAGTDSARAVVEFYFEKLAIGEKANLKELLARGKVNDETN